MKTIDNWTIIRALNKHEDLAIKLNADNNKIHITKVWYDKSIKSFVNEIILDIEDVDVLLDSIAKVMTKKRNCIYAFNEQKKQDIYLKLIDYNKAFKVRDTLKLDLYDYIGVNESSYSSITISKESARNLYKVLLVIKNNRGGIIND